MKHLLALFLPLFMLCVFNLSLVLLPVTWKFIWEHRLDVSVNAARGQRSETATFRMLHAQMGGGGCVKCLFIDRRFAKVCRRKVSKTHANIFMLIGLMFCALT